MIQGRVQVTVFMPIPIPMPAFALGLGYMFYGVSGAAKVTCACLSNIWTPCFWLLSVTVPLRFLLTLHPCIGLSDLSLLHFTFV